MIFSAMRDLETERLLLRKFKTEDAPCVYKNYAGNDNVTKYLTWPTHLSVGDSYKYIDFVVKSYEAGRHYKWAIVLKSIGEVIGSISIVRAREEEDDVEIGYCISENFWHMGIASEALNAVIQFVKRDMGPHRIFAGHDINNPHLGSVMKKCGMNFYKRMFDGDNNQGQCTIDIYEIIL